MGVVYAASFDTYSTEDVGRHWIGRDGSATGYVGLEREGKQDGYFVSRGLDACAWRPLDNELEDGYVVGFRFRTDWRTWDGYSEQTVISLQEDADDANLLRRTPASLSIGWNEAWGQLMLEYGYGTQSTRPGSMIYELTGITNYYSTGTCRTLYTGRWHYLEFLINAAAKHITIRIDGSVELDTDMAADVVLPPVTYLVLGNHNGYWNNTVCQYDDLYVATLDSGFLGPCRVVPCVPKARNVQSPPSRWVAVNAPDTVRAVGEVPLDPSSYARLPAVPPVAITAQSQAYQYQDWFEFDYPTPNHGGYLSVVGRTDQSGDYIGTMAGVGQTPAYPLGGGVTGYQTDPGSNNPATGSWKQYGTALDPDWLTGVVDEFGPKVFGMSAARYVWPPPSFTPTGNVDVAQVVLEVVVPDSALPLELSEPVSTVFVASDDGLWRKLAGLGWERVYAGACTKIQGPFFQKPRARMRHRGPQTLVLQAAAGWFTSVDHGTTWTPLPLPVGIAAGNVKSIAFMDQDHARAIMLVSGLSSDPPTKNGLYTSFDALKTWFQKYRPPPGTQYLDVVGCEMYNEGAAAYVMAGHNIGDPTPWSNPPLPGNDREVALIGSVYEGSDAEWPLPLYGQPNGPLTAANQGGTPSLGRPLHYYEQNLYCFYQDSAAPLTMGCYFQNNQPGGSDALTLSSDCTPDRTPFNVGRPRWVAGTGYRKYAHWLDPSTGRGGIYYTNRIRDWVLVQPPTAELFVPINHGAPSLAIDREESRIVYVMGATTLWTSQDDGLTWASTPAPWTGPRCMFTLEPFTQAKGTGL